MFFDKRRPPQKCPDVLAFGAQPKVTKDRIGNPLVIKSGIDKRVLKAYKNACSMAAKRGA